MSLSRINRFLRRTGYSIVRNDYSPEHSDIFCAEERSFSDAYARVEGYSLTSYERMFALHKAVQYISRAHIPGDMVECGVWRGGSSMMVAHTLLQCGDTDRRLYLYDTYEGMPAGSENDRDYGGRSSDEIFSPEKRADNLDNLAISIEEVSANLKGTKYPQDKIVLVKGKVEETIPHQSPEQIALLRLDTDFFESTYHELVHLWPRVVSRGVVIIDDYGHWKGARMAVDRFFEEQGLSVLLQRVDYTARLLIKS